MQHIATYSISMIDRSHDMDHNNFGNNLLMDVMNILNVPTFIHALLIKYNTVLQLLTTMIKISYVS